MTSNNDASGVLFKKDIWIVGFSIYLTSMETMSMGLTELIEKYLSSIDKIPTSKEVNEINIKSYARFSNSVKKVNSFFNIAPSEKTPYIYISKYSAPDSVTTTELSYENGKFTEEKKSYTHPNIPDKEEITFTIGSSVIENMKKDINGSRLLVEAWNPAELHLTPLPPCHTGFQIISTDGGFELHWKQRSVDLFLGLPFNIASYSLLLAMVAQVTGLKPFEFIHTLGDAHLYLNHIEQALD